MTKHKDRERLLDRLRRSRQYLASTVPLRFRRKVLLSLRTAYAVFLVLILLHFWEFSDVALYLAPVIAIIASAPYFGLLQDNFIKMIRSTPVCAALGVVVGFSSDMKAVQLVLIFVGVFWITVVPNWDRLSGLIGLLSFIIGAVYPNLSPQTISGNTMFGAILALTILPFLITGFSLLIPSPALAIYSAKFQAMLICRKLAHMTIAVVKAFLSQDDLDTCITEFDQYKSELVTDVAALKALTGFVDYERLVFRSVDNMPEALSTLIMVVDRVLQDLVGARDMVVRVSFNKTQHHFANKVRPSLIEMAEQIEIALTLIGEHFDSYDPFASIIPSWLRTAWDKLLQCSCRKDPGGSLPLRMGKTQSIPTSHTLIEEHLHRTQLQSHGLSGHPTAPHGTESGEGMQHYSFTVADIEQGSEEGKADGRENEAGMEAEENASARSSCDHFHRSAASHAKDSEAGESDYAPCTRELFRLAILDLSRARSVMLQDYSDARKDIIMFNAEEPDDGSTETAPTTVIPSFGKPVADMGHQRRVERSEEQGKERGRDGLERRAEGSHRQRDLPVDPLSAPCTTGSDFDSPSLSSLARRRENIVAMRQETMRLSWYNFGPRGAYMHRVSMAVEFIAQLEQVFTVKATPFNIFSYLASCGMAVLIYFLVVGKAWLQGFAYCRASFAQHSSQPCTAIGDIAFTFLTTYSQSIKVAATVLLTSSVLIYDLMPFLYQGGLWMTMVVVIVRQDLTSSSILTSIQRLEGTVIGAMYAFLAFTIFSCSSRNCGYFFQFPVLIVWVFICGLFRDGPQHGYSATVAAITPIILIMSPVADDMGAWGRIEETFLGILFYVVIDNLFLPKRIYPQAKALVLACIEDARLIYKECMSGLQTITDIEQFYSENRTEPSWQWKPSVTQEDGVGVYGLAANMRYRSNTQISLIEGNAIADIVAPHKLSGRSLLNSDAGSSADHAVSPSPTSSLRSPAPEDEAPSLVDQSAPPSIQGLLFACSQHFNTAEAQLIAMKGRLARLEALVGLVQYEPELWRRSFPRAVYERLLEAFNRVFISGLSLNSGARAFTVVMCQMMRKNENISQHLANFRYMIKHLFLISAKADDAMLQAYDAFKKMYARTGEDVDLSSLLTLRRVCEKLTMAVEEHFREEYMQRSPEVLLTLSPYFLVAWQTVFESCHDLIKDLSGLGTTLLTVRNTESLLSM